MFSSGTGTHAQKMLAITVSTCSLQKGPTASACHSCPCCDHEVVCTPEDLMCHLTVRSQFCQQRATSQRWKLGVCCHFFWVVTQKKHCVATTLAFFQGTDSPPSLGSVFLFIPSYYLNTKLPSPREPDLAHGVHHPV